MNEIIKIDTDIRSVIMKKTNPSYSTEIKQFLDVAVNDLSLDIVRTYIDDLKKNSYRAATVNKHIAAIKNMIRCLFDNPNITLLQRYQLEYALQEIKPFVMNKDKNVIPADKVISKLDFETLRLQSPEDIALIMEFLWFTGCRISEALNIKLSDCVQKDDKYIISIIGKGNKARRIRLSTELFNKIIICFQGEVYLFEKDGKMLSRNNICNKIKRLSKRYINKVITPHCFRHSFATHMIQRTGKIKGVSEYIGHASTAITMDMYNHEVLNDDDLF